MIRITRKAADQKQALTTVKALEALGGQKIQVAAHGMWGSNDGISVLFRCEGFPILGWGRNGAVRAEVDGQQLLIKPLEKSSYREAGHIQVECWLSEHA